MRVFDLAATTVEELTDIDEEQGKIGISKNEALMHSVLENDKSTIDDGKLIADAFNRGLGNFTPDLFFEQMVKNYSLAKQLFGDTILRLVSGYNPDYIERNLPIPEFRKELRANIHKRIDALKNKDLVEKDGIISDKGVDLASAVLYVEELNHLIPKGIMGETVSKKIAHYGERTESRTYRKGDRYKDISTRATVRTAIRRGHADLAPSDLRTQERKSKGSVSIIYGIDASASMKGTKIEQAKKAGIALAFQAIQHKDNVGLVVFGNDVKSAVEPTQNFPLLLRTLTTIRASRETDFTQLITKAIELFPSGGVTKHLLVLTDAMPTVGDKPEEETLAAIGQARAAGITVSVVGIQLDDKSKAFAEQLALLGEGRLYLVRNLGDLDKIVLEDYRAVTE